MSTALPVIEIDGAVFTTLDEFFEHFSQRALDGAQWGKNLDAFNDVLRGGFGTPEGGFRLHWLNHARSKELLGFAETVRQLELRLARCHPESRDWVQSDLTKAQNSQGPTVFDWLIDVISIHCAGGEEEEDGIELVLL